MTTSTDDTPRGQLVLDQTEDGRTRAEVRFEGDSPWLSLRRRCFIPQTGDAA